MKVERKVGHKNMLKVFFFIGERKSRNFFIIYPDRGKFLSLIHVIVKKYVFDFEP